MKRILWLTFGLLVVFALAGCDEWKQTQQAMQNQSAASNSSASETGTNTPVPPTPTASNTPTDTSTPLPPTPTNTPEPTFTATPEPLGPLSYPAGISPLSGEPVQNPDQLQWPPVMVSISNFPITARPQSGLSYTPFVYETYIGEGMTRYLALFYGDFPLKPSENNPSGGQGSSNSTPSDEIGPIRSGRLVYEQLRKQNNGIVVMVSGFARVRATITEHINVFGADEDGAGNMLSIDQLDQIAQDTFARFGNSFPAGLLFDAAVPAGGKPASKVWLPWSYRNQVWWVYDPQAGVYRRWQDQADGQTFVEQTDALTGEPLGFENVIFLFAEHHAESETIYNITLTGVTNGNALLVRDGQIYPIFWTSQIDNYELTNKTNRPIRYYDANGNPFPLKPGQTWVEILPLSSYFDTYETVDTYDWGDLVKLKTPGSGIWAVRFHAPVIGQ